MAREKKSIEKTVKNKKAKGSQRKRCKGAGRKALTGLSGYETSSVV